MVVVQFFNTTTILNGDTVWSVKQVFVNGKLLLDTNQIEQHSTVIPLSTLGLKNRSWINIEFIKIKGSKFNTVVTLDGKEKTRKDSWWRH